MCAVHSTTLCTRNPALCPFNIAMCCIHMKQAFCSGSKKSFIAFNAYL